MGGIFMNKPSSVSIISIITKLLVLALIAKSFALGVWYYFGEQNVELKNVKNYQPKYQRVDFHFMIEKQKIKKVIKVVKKKVTGPSITSMVLKGLYGKGENGFAIVALKSRSKKTTVVSIGEEFSGYTLHFINAQSVVFQKNGKDYILELPNTKINQKSVQKVSSLKRKTQQKHHSVEEDDDEPKEVSRNDIKYFAKHPREIWKNISIHEVKRGKRIIGFRISKINPNSKFAILGLKSGDLITQANNIILNSYRNAIDLYNNMDKIETMQIIVIRDGREKELVYEIN
jgi:type II secretion system protein C